MWATKFNTYTTGKITVLCILIFTFSDSKLEDRRFAPNDKFSLPSISSQFLPEYNFGLLGFSQMVVTLRPLLGPYQIRIKIHLDMVVGI